MNNGQLEEAPQAAPVELNHEDIIEALTSMLADKDREIAMLRAGMKKVMQERQERPLA